MKFLNLTVLLISCIFFCESALAQENSLDFPANPRTSILTDSSLYSKGLASACLSLTSLPDDLPCAASNLVHGSKSIFSGQLALSNGYSSLNLIREAIGSNLSTEFIDLIIDQKVFQIDTGIRIYFKSKYFAGKYVPMSVRAFIGLRNEVNPNIDIFAVEEKGFYFQVAAQVLTENLSLGAQIRALDRTLIKSTFKASDFGVEQSDKLVSSEQYKVLYLDPSITYRLPRLYNLVLTGSILNIGDSDLEGRGDVEEPVSVRLGASAEKGYKTFGKIKGSIEYGRQNYTESFFDALNLGVEYTYGGMKVIGGLNTYGMSTGVYFGISNIQAGIVYSSSRFPDVSNDSYVQTVYVQLGWRSE
ncbi:MAG: hypothetical protein ACRBBP_09150 [Bdellovibrionales bacterium]